MDFLNKAFAQFNDLFRSMSPAGRITAGLLLVVAVASVGYLFQSQVSGGDDYLFGGMSFSTPAVQKMEEAFGQSGLNGFTIDGGRVKVSHSQRAAYLAALADHQAMPQYPGEMLGKSPANDLLADPRTRERNYTIVKQQELSLVISSMRGIERASVMLDTQNQPGLMGPPLKTASVSAQAIGSVPLDDEQVDNICYYVAASVAGMKPENVTVLDTNGRARTISRSGSDGDAYALAVRKAEQNLTAKVREALSYIPNLSVTSNVTLDHEKGSRSVEIKNGPKPVPVQTSEDSTTTSRESSPAGGSPGLLSQAPGGGANQPASLAAGGKGVNETSEVSKNRTVNAVDQTSTEKETFGLTPTLARVSVGIPSSYFEKVWKERNPDKGNDDPQKQTAIDALREEIVKDVRSHIAPLLQLGPEIKDTTSLVTVTSFPDIKGVEIPSPPITQRMLSWLEQNWTMVAMIGLVLFSLNMLRSLLRSSAPPSAASSAIAARVSAGESGAPGGNPLVGASRQEAAEPVEATAARRLRRISGSGPSLRDELSEFVKEDPDSAANILRTWIGQVN